MKEYPLCLTCKYFAPGVNAGGQCFMFLYSPIDVNFNDVCNGYKKKEFKEIPELDKDISWKEGGA